MTEQAKAAAAELVGRWAEVMRSDGDRPGAQRCAELLTLVRDTPAADAAFARLGPPPVRTDDDGPWGYANDAVVDGAHADTPLDRWLSAVVKAMALDRQMALLSRCCGRTCIDCVLTSDRRA
jgi:hypothetical protein